MPSRSRWNFGVVTVVLLVVVIVGAVSYVGWRQSVSRPTASVAPALRLVGQKTPATVTVEAARGHIAQAEVRLLQGGTPFVIHKQEHPRLRRVEMPVTIDARALGLKEGSAALEIWARDDFWRPLRFDDKPLASVPVTIDLTPPAVEVLSATQYLYQGGGGLIAFRVKGGEHAQVRVGDRAFPSFAVGDTGARIALIALPWDAPASAPITVTAQDEAGNASTRGITTEVRTRRFPRDRIEIKDGFLQAKVPELLPQHPSSQPLIEGFLVINRDHRKQAEEHKRRTAEKTADKALWEGAFVQPPNSKVFANFAERREYVYGGQLVDTQVHLGFDVASLKQSAVPAANHGVVVFTGPVTIYGNTVFVDHGLGLQTLYAHLSSIDVKPGDAVKKGQSLGRSGTTGLAIGDHVHFETLIGGVSVTPMEWWDAKWIRDRISKPLKEAGLPQIAGAQFVEAVGAEAPSASPRSAAPSRSTSRSRRSR